MPRIRVTMEAEVGDLPGFQGRAGRQNVFSLLNDLSVEVLARRIESMTSGAESEAVAKALERSFQEDKAIMGRLIGSLRVKDWCPLTDALLDPHSGPDAIPIRGDLHAPDKGAQNAG